jgi:hypothetical protein
LATNKNTIITSISPFPHEVEIIKRYARENDRTFTRALIWLAMRGLKVEEEENAKLGDVINVKEGP